MDDLPRVETLVRRLATDLSIPVTVKIRKFPNDLPKTIAYAAMLERAGAWLVAVHGRTRDQKRASEVRADWDAIKAVKAALRVPVLANGNIRTLADVGLCMEYTGADGVMSAESLLADPALFADRRLTPGGAATFMCGPRLLLEYLDLCEQYPTPWRMVKGHAFKLLGPWLAEYIDLRERLNKGHDMDNAALREMTLEVMRRADASGRDHPVPALSERQLAAMEAEAGLAAAIEEQEREAKALGALEGARTAAAATP
jgi:tRNA-dihydrouridine synthase 1